MSNYDVSRFKHVTVALNTPFQSNGDLDLEATKKLTRYYVNKGIKSLYVCGSTGEGFLLDQEERKKIVETVVNESQNQLSVIVHVGCPSTRHSIELAKHAYEVGAHATSAVPCVYYRPSEESVYTHWTDITKAADLPFFIYNIPQLTGFHLSMNLFHRMIKNERVVGVKCSSEPCHDILRYKQAADDNFIVFNGPDEQYLAGRMMGADAGIGGTYGAMPELYLKLDDLINKGNITEAKKLQVSITDFIYRLCSFPSMYGACKSIIRLDGVDIGDPRLPFLPVSSTDDNLIRLYQDIRNKVEETKYL